ncbi:MAG TPA: ThiF family adenylyltransferase [Candidatus Pacearchaeota archaeon]|nr:ThiF family adenylyltransferase [Candidatus Pacearchaeota archaeon]HOK94444.1 ThiF family adenylyltransferase [Candidatus Pacearchaeota archaeon]
MAKNSKPNLNYKDLVLRHKFIIPKKLQEKIKKCKIMLLGCGLGAQIGVLAARTGFMNFVLIDGDKVDISNLNRQAFRYKHIGKNKAEALASMIKEINPKANVEYYPIFLRSKKLAKELIDKSDVVVNMADPEEILYFVNDYSQDTGKPVFFPLNIAWGGYVLVFTPDSPKLREIVGEETYRDNRFYLKLLQNTFSTFPADLLQFYKKMGQKNLSELSGPQLGATTYLTSSIVVNGIVKWLSGQPLKKAPQPIFLDLWEEV